MDSINRKQWAAGEKVALSVLNNWTFHVKELDITLLRMFPQREGNFLHEHYLHLRIVTVPSTPAFVSQLTAVLSLKQGSGVLHPFIIMSAPLCTPLKIHRTRASLHTGTGRASGMGSMPITAFFIHQ